MSDKKEPQYKVGDLVELVAVDRGFRNGKLVEPGRKFSYTVIAGKDGKPRLPKWAQLASEPLKPKKEPQNGDLKPKDTQAAVADKQKGLANGAQGASGLV